MRRWLDGVEPAWMLLTFESLRALRQEPSAARTTIRIANDLSREEIATSPIGRNTLILLGEAIVRGGLPLTATGNLTRAVVAEMCKRIEWPDFDQADAFRTAMATAFFAMPSTSRSRSGVASMTSNTFSPRARTSFLA